MRYVEVPLGSRFGRLTVAAVASRAASGERMFECRCDCGEQIQVRSSSLRKGATNSCGCLRRELDAERAKAARDTFAERFLRRVAVASADECWQWKASIDSKGYGLVRVPGKRRQQLASRVSYELHHGPIPHGLFVCHRCDNPPCVNPAHLFLGTANDNTQDMIAKGRDRKARGEANGFAKLTDAQAKEIRESGEPLRKVAVRYGITFGHAGKIRRGELRA